MAIIGYPILATVTFATKSDKEFPCREKDLGDVTIANTVTPRIASLTPTIAPNARRIPTTSSAIVDIQPMPTTNPTAHNALCQLGGLFGEENVSNNANAINPEIRA